MIEKKYTKKQKYTQEQLWQECVEFHGHSCGGLKIGFMAAIYAMELLGLAKETEGGITITSTEDEEIVCISENDACGIDAVQYITGCTAGKGNLKFEICGKQAFSFFNRKTGKAFRIVLNEQGASKDHMMKMKRSEVFSVKETRSELPPKAKIYKSIICQSCGEKTAEPYIHNISGEEVCTACRKICN